MPPRTVSNTRRKKSAVSKEEQLRQQREEEDRLRLEQVVKLEKEAEEFQRRENEERDAAELKERKRLKKELQMKVLAEKDALISELGGQLAALQSAFSNEREDLEGLMQQKQSQNDLLHDELSRTLTEHDSAYRELLSNRDSLIEELHRTSSDLSTVSQTLSKLRQESDAERNESDSLIGRLHKEKHDLQEQADATRKELSEKNAALEATVEKVSTLNMTLQSALESREADDRKNVTLLQLLNSQLDETKRRSQEIIDQEKLSAKALRQQLTVLERQVQQISEEKIMVERQLNDVRDSYGKSTQEQAEKIKHFEFETKYLASQLHQHKTQISSEIENHDHEIERSKAELHDARSGLDLSKRKTEELESLLRRKDREHFDKVAFLNAQLSNSRTVLNQLQGKLTQEREAHEHEMRSCQDKAVESSASCRQTAAELAAREAKATDVEGKLSADISVLKNTVFQLQSALLRSEGETQTLMAQKDKEIEELRANLADNFVPRIASQAAGLHDQSDKLMALEQKLSQAAALEKEAESRLKAQLANQNSIIEALHSEVTALRDVNLQDSTTTNEELKRLRQLLDLHSIPR